jgi:hypothetical protein
VSQGLGRPNVDRVEIRGLGGESQVNSATGNPEAGSQVPSSSFMSEIVIVIFVLMRNLMSYVVLLKRLWCAIVCG